MCSRRAVSLSLEQEKFRVLDEIREDNNRGRDRADIDILFATLREGMDEVWRACDRQLGHLEKRVRALHDETKVTALKFQRWMCASTSVEHVSVGQKQDTERRKQY